MTSKGGVYRGLVETKLVIFKLKERIIRNTNNLTDYSYS